MEFRILTAGVEDAVWEPLLHPFLDFGYSLAPAADGEEAGNIFDRTKLDLLILDLDGLGPSGPEMIRRFRAADQPLAKVLVLSSHPVRDQEIRAAGCDRFLRKPLSKETLVEEMCALILKKDAEAVARRLLSCEFQPKEFVFFMHAGDKNREILNTLPGRRWTGNPWNEEALKALIQVIGRTALEHRLVAAR